VGGGSLLLLRFLDAVPSSADENEEVARSNPKRERTSAVMTASEVDRLGPQIDLGAGEVVRLHAKAAHAGGVARVNAPRTSSKRQIVYANG
jgi:hypothetical protein